MSVNNVNNNVSLKEKWNKLSTPAKVATVAVPVALAGGTALSYSRGKVILADQFSKSNLPESDKKFKFFETVKEGIKTIFTKQGREKFTTAKTIVEDNGKLNDTFASLDKEEQEKLSDLTNVKTETEADLTSTKMQ